MTPATEYLTLTACPDNAWWAALSEQAAQAGAVTVTRSSGQTAAGHTHIRLVLTGEAAAVAALRTWVVRTCWQAGIGAVVV